MKKKRLAIILIFAGIVILVLLAILWKMDLIKPRAQTITPQASLYLNPSSAEVQVDQTLTVQVMLDTAGQTVDGVDIKNLNYDPSLLKLQDADSNTEGTQILAGELFATYPYNLADTTNGKVAISGISNPDSTGFSGSGVFATLTFTALQQGSVSINFDFTSGSTTDTNVVSRGVSSDLLAQVTNGQYTINTISSTTGINANLTLQAKSTTGTIDTGVSLVVYNAGSSEPLSQLDNLTIASGQISAINFSGLTEGSSYDYVLKVKNYLNKKIANQTLANPMNLDFGVLKTGDLYYDNIIDISDFAIMKANWGTNQLLSDLNADGIVDISDFAILKGNWGQQGN